METRFYIHLASPPQDFQLTDEQLDIHLLEGDTDPVFVESSTEGLLRTMYWMHECRRRIEAAGVLNGLRMGSEGIEFTMAYGADVAAFEPLRAFLARENLGELIDCNFAPANNNRPHPSLDLITH